MSRFLKLCEQFDPTRSGDIHDLISFLKGHGVHANLISGGRPAEQSNQISIPIDGKMIYLTVMEPEEEAESINASTGSYDIDNEVTNLADTAAKLGGKLGGMLGAAPQQAKAAVKERGRLSAQAVNAYKTGTQRIKQGLANMKKTAAIKSTY